MKKNFIPIIIVSSVVAVGLGILISWLIRSAQAPEGQTASLGSGGTVELQQVATDVESIKAGDVFGSPDESTFKDSAQGYLAAGGVNGEGTHQLQRIGGESQTVALNSSITDLDALVGMEVEVWGETFAGQASGWLMDVGRVKVVNPQGTSPLVTE